jgi:hypothetical protein
MPTVSIIPNFSFLPLYLVATGLQTIRFLFYTLFTVIAHATLLASTSSFEAWASLGHTKLFDASRELPVISTTSTFKTLVLQCLI